MSRQRMRWGRGTTPAVVTEPLFKHAAVPELPNPDDVEKNSVQLAHVHVEVSNLAGGAKVLVDRVVVVHEEGCVVHAREPLADRQFPNSHGACQGGTIMLISG